jgi:S-adenosylmethionine uptake transporter
MVFSGTKAFMSKKMITPQLWVLQKGYPQGVFWAILTALVSVSNDVITKFIGTRLDGLEVSFFRFLFSMLTVLPFMLRQGVAGFKTTSPKLHWWRAILGVGAIALYIYALITLPLAEVIVFSFTQPIFFMPLAILFLGEKVTLNRWIAAILGFSGILIMINPGNSEFNFFVLIPMGAAFLFASLDLLAKKMVSNETTTTLLFYFALGTTLAAGLALLVLVPYGSVAWKMPTIGELSLLFLLGAGANLIQVCLFKAFSATEASSLAPFRYTELVFAVLFGYVLFSEVPLFRTFIGAGIIIASTLYMSYAEMRKRG